jgi:hypothetical protein
MSVALLLDFYDRKALLRSSSSMNTRVSAPLFMATVFSLDLSTPNGLRGIKNPVDPQ